MRHRWKRRKCKLYYQNEASISQNKIHSSLSTRTTTKGILAVQRTLEKLSKVSHLATRKGSLRKTLLLH
jgi:hypothetical protein